MIRTLTIIMTLVLSGTINLIAQEPSITEYLAHCEDKYGSDTDLVNGEKYFYPYTRTLGDPFLYNEPRTATVRIHGKEFSGQMLRYDIFNQQLILDFQNLYGSSSSLVLRDEWVEAFFLEGKSFKKLKSPEGSDAYYQFVTEGPISCIYFWEKDYLLNLNSGVQEYYFTEADKKTFLYIDQQFYPYKSNGNFIKTFDPAIQKSIKQFIRQAKIKVKSASDSQMRHLVQYCNSLSHDN